MIEKTLAELTLNITDGKHGDCRGKDDSGFYFISCKDVRDGQIHYEDARQIIEEDFWDTHKRTRLEPEDILVTNSGTIGRMAFIRDVPLTYRTTFQKSVAIVKPDKSKILPKYLYYHLQNCVDGFVNQSNGAAQKNLLLSTMRAFKMNIHEDEDTQIRIASILSAYDDLIENNLKQIKLLEEAAQRLYKEWFVDLRFPGHETTPITDGIPKGWTVQSMNDIAEYINGYAFKPTDWGTVGKPIIEEDGSVIHVRQAVNLVKGSVHVGVPKSRDSYRDIPVPPTLRWCAQEIRKVDTKFIWEKRKRDTPCNPSNFRDEFKEAIAKIEGVRVLTPHSCRHTYVSQMQALGVDLSTIQSIVGHADVDMTQHYLHVQDGIRQEAIHKFAQAFPLEDIPPEDPETGTCRVIRFPHVG